MGGCGGGLGQRLRSERRHRAEGKQAIDVKLGEAKWTKQKWAWFCRGPSSFASDRREVLGLALDAPRRVVARGLREVPRAAAAKWALLSGPPASLVFQAVSV